MPKRVLTAEPDNAAGRTTVIVAGWTDDHIATQATRSLAELASNPPGGLIAPTITPLIAALLQATPANLAVAKASLLDAIAGPRATIGNLPQPALLAWFGAVEAATSALGSPAGPMGATGQSWTRDLTVPPSRPPVSAERLTRSTATSFSPGSDASFQMLGTAIPAVRANLAAALAGDRAVAPEIAFRVYALRLRAGLFGRTFPKRTKLVRSDIEETAVEEIGEWPLITRAGPRERESLVTLDSAYSGIAAGSWVLIDMRSVDRPNERDWLVDRADAIVLARVARLSPGLPGPIMAGPENRPPSSSPTTAR